MDLFKVSPESKMMFRFLQHYDIENDQFFDLVSKHSLRVLGVVGALVKEVRFTNKDNTNYV